MKRLAALASLVAGLAFAGVSLRVSHTRSTMTSRLPPASQIR